MQGNLAEIDIRSIFQLIALGQRTGQLFIEGIPDRASSRSSKSAPFWLLFFERGAIAYASSSEARGSDLSRLQDYLRRYSGEVPRLPGAFSPDCPAEYAALGHLLASRSLTPAQGRAIVRCLVEETLFDLLSLHRGFFSFDGGEGLPTGSWLPLPAETLVEGSMRQVQQWKELYPHIHSPQQCPAIVNEVKLRATLTQHAYRTLARACNGQISLRRLSRYLNRNLLATAKAIYPYVKRGWVELDPIEPIEPAASRPPRIVCIDDNVTIARHLEYILKQHHCEVRTETNPTQAVALILASQPDLIFCDITMPELNGYELCSMLQSVPKCRATPVIMLTSNEGFLDRARARMAGARDYLTKPFQPGEIAALLEQHLGWLSSMKVQQTY